MKNNVVACLEMIDRRFLIMVDVYLDNVKKKNATRVIRSVCEWPFSQGLFSTHQIDFAHLFNTDFDFAKI